MTIYLPNHKQTWMDWRERLLPKETEALQSRWLCCPWPAQDLIMHSCIWTSHGAMKSGFSVWGWRTESVQPQMIKQQTFSNSSRRRRYWGWSSRLRSILGHHPWCWPGSSSTQDNFMERLSPIVSGSVLTTMQPFRVQMVAKLDGQFLTLHIGLHV